MELTAKIAALEEEIHVLKGEIKSILQEVRVALLARDNPFTSDGAGVSRTSFLPSPAPQETPAVGGADSPPLLAALEAEAAPAVPLVRPERHATKPGNERPRPFVRARDLAALMAWTQEAAERMTQKDFALVLSLAQYGGLIDEALRDTLLSVGQTLCAEKAPRASASDFALAVRQLEAVVGEEPRQAAGRAA